MVRVSLFNCSTEPDITCFACILHTKPMLQKKLLRVRQNDPR